MTASRRTTVLMLVLLVLVLGYVTRPYWEPSRAVPMQPEPPLAGKNSVAALEVTQDADGRWFATVEYFFTGAPTGATVHLRLLKDARAQELTQFELDAQRVAWLQAERGQHRQRMELERPDFGNDAFATEVVQVDLTVHRAAVPLATTRVLQRIQWPDLRSWLTDRELAGKTPAQILAKAVALIDEGDARSLATARRLLERLIRQDPQLDAGYVELARLAMKSNWGPEGLHQAETLLASALGIRPDNVDAKILLGYVFAHQGHHRQAEALFAQGEASGSKNLWLWSNWGELLAMQAKNEQAIEKYRRALAVPPTHDSNDRARVDAYAKLLKLLEARRDHDGIEKLYEQRIADYGQADCVGAEYALFVLRKRGDTGRAIELARLAGDGQCRPRAALALGMAQYVAWSNAPEPNRAQLLNEARVSLPVSSGVLYELAADDRTAGTVRKLILAGEPIDQRDNSNVNALAHALQRGDHAAARRLLTFGARPGAFVGVGGVPVAFIPLVAGDVEGVRLMRQFGVDYSHLTYQGRTAVEVARELGNPRILDALGATEQRNRL